MDLLILPEYFSELEVLLCVCIHTHIHTYTFTHIWDFWVKQSNLKVWLLFRNKTLSKFNSNYWMFKILGIPQKKYLWSWWTIWSHGYWRKVTSPWSLMNFKGNKGINSSIWITSLQDCSCVSLKKIQVSYLMFTFNTKCFCIALH